MGSKPEPGHRPSQTVPDGAPVARDDAWPIDQLDPGDPLGRYVVIARLGAGSTGVVYAAKDGRFRREVAVKVLRSGAAGPTAEAVRRLIHEGRALAKLSHENIVAVFEVASHQGQLFFVMERIDGVTLTQWLEREPRGWPDVLEVFVQAGRGLAAAHAAGIVHRDFKPENAMVDAAGRVRVTDFGLARHPSMRDEVGRMATVEGRSSEAGSVMGTPAYMAPEQHLGLPTSAETDQFNFCAALYEGLYGTRPFAGDSRIELMHAVTKGRVRDAPMSSPVPARLRSVVLRGLAVQPHDRFESMRGLLDQLIQAATADSSLAG